LIELGFNGTFSTVRLYRAFFEWREQKEISVLIGRQVRESGEARRRNGRGKEVSEREGKAAEERTV